MSAVIGSETDWHMTEEAWVERTGGEVFHAAECEYAGRTDLYKDLTTIVADSYLAGFTVALDLKSFREIFPDAPRGPEYYKCLTDLLYAISRTASRFNENASKGRAHSGDEPVLLKLTFDDRKESNGTAGVLYSLLIAEPEWEHASPLGTELSFDNRANPRIQIADLLAREAMKDLDRIVDGKGRPARRSKQALDAKEKFHFLVRDRTYWEFLRGQMPRLEKEFGLSADGYRSWLLETGRVQHGRPHDNWRNRFEYAGRKTKL